MSDCLIGITVVAEAFDNLARDGSRLHGAFFLGICRDPDAGDLAFDGQSVLFVEAVLNHETAAAPLGDRSFCEELIAERCGKLEAGANIDDRNSDNSLRREKSVERNARGGKQRRSASVKPDHVVGEKYDPSGIAISPLHGNAAVMFEHGEALCPAERKSAANSETSRA
jgi:hypothetical protein